MPDLSLAPQGVKCADRLCEGDGWVGSVQLVEIDAIKSKLLALGAAEAATRVALKAAPVAT